jgi:hypothetical protein
LNEIYRQLFNPQLYKRKYSVIPSLLARDEASLAWSATRRAERCWPPGR